MISVLRLITAIAVLAAPVVPARAADACLLCGGGANVGGGGAARPPIDIEMSAGFNFRRFTAGGSRGDVLVESNSWDGSEEAGYALVGHVLIRGAPNAQLSVALPASVTLISRDGGRIVLDNVRADLPKDARLDVNGRLEFSFSAPLTLPAGAQPGNYRASFSIDASYD